MKIKKDELKKLIEGSGLVSPQKLKEAVEIAEDSKSSLDQVLLKRRLITEKDLYKLYSSYINIPVIDLDEVQVPKDILQKLPERIARKYQAVFFGEEEGGKKLLAMVDPEDFQAVEFIEKQSGYQTKIYLATPSDISFVLDQYRGGLNIEISQAIKKTQEVVPKEELSKDATTEEVKEIVEEAPIARAVNIIMEYAVKSRASDIHIEPRENFVRVRYRIDGVLRDTMSLPKEIISAIVSRVKILSNLKIDEHRIPQDGRFKITVAGKNMAVRVSTLPIVDGEKVVMRLLDETTKAQTLEELGFKGRALEIVKKNIKRPHGMTIVSGPTGSGKSTTLYSILTLLNTVGVNISTIEDPVEYRVQGVNQTQVNPKTGMTFANGLRALLRQDPDIIMVGEIRDNETAEMAIHAALTGHIVLSTLHTNDAATSLPRLLDMGIESFLIASTVNTVVAQRLVRKICPHCKEKYTPNEKILADVQKEFSINIFPEKKTETKVKDQKGSSIKVIPGPSKSNLEKKTILEKIAEDPTIINRGINEKDKEQAENLVKEEGKGKKEELLDLEKIILYKGSGCQKCEKTGYLGRTGIYEVLEVDDEIGEMIINRASSEEINAKAISKGMLTIKQDGFLKILEGVTTIEEVLRVTKE